MSWLLSATPSEPPLNYAPTSTIDVDLGVSVFRLKINKGFPT